ncbi:unnamed protein product [Cylindrotheca closterium]|uniref:Cap-specific mRNA (nucleoside-2'-O-)-methyltransferase 1 n=1 Tax=Cylindrotheca closterium TaxID=2856 RepID=A0AAD2CL04_9STRA|nr:unnamed protein product [Cylindrotheca closterium]
MIVARDTDWRSEEENARSTKRRRSAGESNTTDLRDFYDQIASGHVNGQIRSSWLAILHRISMHNRDSGIVQPNMEVSAAIKSLSRQLIQAKRRLWPAAERCAEVTGSRPEREFGEARRFCNPMEPLGEGNQGGLNQMFMNRAAIKLANIDAILGFALTQVNSENFFFADLCGAPGGFSEYLLKRSQETRTSGFVRGYGMSLVGTNEHGHGTGWNLGHINHQNLSYQVSGGADGSGDIYNSENVKALSRGIEYDMHFSKLRPQKMHLVVADGGFDAQRNSECQEELATKLILCEIAAAMYLLQQGGTLVIKMFGFQTNTIRVAMRDLFDFFDELTILKPISSRPASAERYVVCKGYRGMRDFDGTEWMNSVFLRRVTPQDKMRYAQFDNKLDEFDMDLLQLNLKACFAILSLLERKAAAQSSWQISMQGGGAPWDSELPPLNVEFYRQAWRL